MLHQFRFGYFHHHLLIILASWRKNHISKRIDFQLDVLTLMTVCGCLLSQKTRSDTLIAKFEAIFLVFVVKLMGNVDLLHLFDTLNANREALPSFSRTGSHLQGRSIPVAL